MDKLLNAGIVLQKQLQTRFPKTSCLQCTRLISSHIRKTLIRRPNAFLRPELSYHTLLSSFPDATNSKGEKRVPQSMLRKLHMAWNKLEKHGYLDDKTHKQLRGMVRLFSRSSKLENEDKDRESQGEHNEKRPKGPPVGVFVFLVLYTLVMLLFMASRSGQVTNEEEIYSQRKEIPWNTFIQELLLKGEVRKVEIRKLPSMVIIYPQQGAKLKGEPAAKVYHCIPQDISTVEDLIREEETKLGIPPSGGIPIIYNTTMDEHVQLIMTVAYGGFLLTLALILWTFMRGRVKVDIKTNMFSDMQGAKFVQGKSLFKTNNAVYFKDVAGLKEAKVEVMEFVDYLKRPYPYLKLGAKVPHGALLLGPPGCGKTHLAKALACEAKVPFFATSGSEFVEVIGGLGASRVRDLFKKAKQAAPCIIYIDEIDAVGRKRQDSGFNQGREGENTLIQLLAEMDGFSTRDNIIVIGSTNRADILDKALLRPGRFDRHIMIDLPTYEERLEIFEMYMGKLALGFPVSTYAPRLAQLTPSLSAADIKNICNEAALNAVRNGKSEVAIDDFDYACERVVSGSAKKTNVLSPVEKKINAYYHAGSALVSWLLKTPDAILKISIIPRTNANLGFSQTLPQDVPLYTSQQLFEKMCVKLAGSVTESVIFNHFSTASENDIKAVRKIAYSCVNQYGMNDTVGQLSFPEERQKPYSNHLASIIDQEVRAIVMKANIATKEIIEKNKDKLDKIASALLERETLSYEDIENLIGPPPHGSKKPAEITNQFNIG